MEKAINNTGIKQAEKTRDLIKNEKIDLILCSPLKRARQTAEIINQNRNINMVIDERISERNFGEFEGIPNLETLLPLCLKNCEVKKYFYKKAYI